MHLAPETNSLFRSPFRQVGAKFLTRNAMRQLFGTPTCRCTELYRAELTPGREGTRFRDVRLYMRRFENDSLRCSLAFEAWRFPHK